MISNGLQLTTTNWQYLAEDMSSKSLTRLELEHSEGSTDKPFPCIRCMIFLTCDISVPIYTDACYLPSTAKQCCYSHNIHLYYPINGDGRCAVQQLPVREWTMIEYTAVCVMWSWNTHLVTSALHWGRHRGKNC